MSKLRLLFTALRIPSDLIALYLSLLCTYYLRYLVLPQWDWVAIEDFITLKQFFSVTSWFPLIGLAIFFVSGAYRIQQRETVAHQLLKIFQACVIWLMAIMSFYFITRTFPFSRLAIVQIIFTSFFIAGFFRVILNRIYSKLIKKGHGKTRVLIVGANNSIRELNKILQNDFHYELIGYHYHTPSKTLNKNLKHLGNYKEIPRMIRKHKIDLIIHSTKDEQMSSSELIEICRQYHTDYITIPEAFDLYEHRFLFGSYKGIAWLEWQKTPLNGWGRIIKRTFDLLIAIPALIILSPLMITTAILIKIDSKGTIFYRYLDNGKTAMRVGQRNQLFYCYKFRTMHPNTHNQRYKDLATKNTRRGPLIKIKDDPRVTRVGKWIRRFDIDEIPQLINVIKGDMSLVGPRPHLPEEVEQYQKQHKFVLTLKPGITGMAQINGRSNLEFDEEVKFDTYYIEHWSLWLDIKILLKTIPVAFKRTDG